MRVIILSVIGMLALLPSISSAQEAVFIQDEISIVKAEVLEIVSNDVQNISGTRIEGVVQKVRVKVLDSANKDEVITFNNDYIELEVGEVFYLRITFSPEDSRTVYAVQEPYRLSSIIFFTLLFIVLVIIFGGIQGIRGLASLLGSLVLIVYVLLPGVLAGFSPILVSIGVSALIIIVGSYITHGFNKTTSSAVIGMIGTVIFTGIMAYIAVHWSRLTGFSSDEAIYLNFDTQGTIDFAGLLLGGILIGLLGVLYDVAIGQAISVEELHRIAPHIPRSTVYKRAIRIGREHIGALVNTLAIAYVGVSLPLLLLYMNSSTSSFLQIINSEIFATEIIRTMIGSIGLVLAVPITTLIAVLMLMKKPTTDISPERLKEEAHAIEHAGHHH